MHSTHARAREPRVETVRLHGLAHGGEAVGRLEDGKAVFVPFAIPGELATVRVTDERARWARAELVEVLEPSPDRVEPACPLFGRCGGCALQHIAGPRRRGLLRQVLVDQLQRIGGLDDPPVAEVRDAGEWAYRTSARFAIARDGALGFRAAGSHDIVAVEHCPLLHPAAQAVRSEVGPRYERPGPEVEEVMVRAAARGDGATLVTLPGASGATITERVGGLEFRVSPGSFFQQNTVGAEILLALVREAAAAAPGRAPR
ncbi:MAG TPA: TRAM domain-containing protein [Egibacteraceae bacterium]|nr:TRAM domain-containing protein [Egibacteraceae bacterium]